MKHGGEMLALLLLPGIVFCGCGGNSGGGITPPPPVQQTAKPTIATTAAQNGAEIVTLADTTSGAKIFYTLDGSKPTSASPAYEAPFLVASNVTLNVMASAAPTYTNSDVATQAFTPNLATGTLVWSDEFTNTGTTPAGPSASTWTYDTGTNCCGNNELETYCAWGSTTAPCDSSHPNAFIGTDNYLHIVAQSPSASVYTSARLKSQSLFSFMYGRIEARMKLPESQGMWPAFWLLGNNITSVNWPACGELDVMEHIDGAVPPGGQDTGDWIAGSVHGGTSGSSELNGGAQYHVTGFSAADWHTYGMIWTKGEIQYYVDDPSNIYATYKSTDSTWNGNTWPFDQGPQFIILNLAVGGDWPGNPNGTTVLPGDMSVDYVRIYTN